MEVLCFIFSPPTFISSSPPGVTRNPAPSRSEGSTSQYSKRRSCITFDEPRFAKGNIDARWNWWYQSFPSCQVISLTNNTGISQIGFLSCDKYALSSMSIRAKTRRQRPLQHLDGMTGPSDSRLWQRLSGHCWGEFPLQRAVRRILSLKTPIRSSSATGFTDQRNASRSRGARRRLTFGVFLPGLHRSPFHHC